MKKYTIATYLRPAVPEDVFDQDGLGTIKNNKQFFYKLRNGSYHGPKRLKALPTDLLYSYRKDDIVALKKKLDVEQASHRQYIQLYQLMDNNMLFVVDAQRYLESVPIHLKIKQVESLDYISNGRVIVNTAYFNYDNFKIKGPFYIQNKHTPQTFINSVLELKMFVFDKPGIIKKIEIETPAEAV